MSALYPDYGTPGSPNMDPYYISPAQEAEIWAEAERTANIMQIYNDQIAAAVENLATDLKASNLKITAVVVTLDPVCVSITTEAA